MIIGINGKLGSGKTAWGYFLGKKMKLVNPLLKVVSNNKFPIVDFNLNRISDFRKYDNCLFLIDDAIEYLDCRESFRNMLDTRLFLISRHKKQDLIWIGQFTSETKGIDVRLRELTNFYYEPSLIKFPSFHIEQYSINEKNDKELLDSFDITYSKEFYSSFDTDYTPEQSVNLKELKDWFVKSENDSKIFRYYVRLELGLSKEDSDMLFYLLYKKKLELLKDILSCVGYKLIGV